MAKPKLKQVAQPQLLKLDLGCGKNKRQGFLGIDERKFDGVDWIADLRSEKWEIRPGATGMTGGCVTAVSGRGVDGGWWLADDSVAEVHCSHFLEHLTGLERVHFFNELYRVMAPGAKGTIIVPHWSSERAYGDPTHQWPPVVFFAFYYLNKEWREANAPHSGYDCNFDATGGNSLAQPWTARNQETQMFSQTHYINVAQDLIVTVTKK